VKKLRVKELCMSASGLCVKELRVRKLCVKGSCEKVARERVVCEKAGVLLPALGQSRPPKRRGGTFSNHKDAN
jgi:hypothetical protein